MSEIETIDIGVLYRGWNSANFIDLTEYIDFQNSEITWEEKENNQFPEFAVKLNAPTDSYPTDPSGTRLMLVNGDEIVFVDRKKSKVIDNSLDGVITFRKVIPQWGETEDDDKFIFETKCQPKNFSLGTVDLDLRESHLLSYVLNLLFTNERTIGLGGYKRNGTVVNKYILPANLDIMLPPIRLKGEVTSILNTLMKMISYDYRLESIPEEMPVPVNLRTFRYVRFFDKAAGYPITATKWKNGLTRQSIRSGAVLNPDYDPINNPKEPKFIACEKSFEYTQDSLGMTNYLKLITYIIGSTNTLTRKEFTTGASQNEFKVGRVGDIVYIAREVVCTSDAFDEEGDIESVTDDKHFTIDEDSASEIQFDADRLSDNNLGTKLVAEIVFDGNTFHRTFTISGQAITLTGGTPQFPSEDGSIPGLDSGTIADFTRFSLINGYDILRPNRPTYPGDGNGYAIKKVKLSDSDNSFELTGYDSPDILNEGDKIVAYVYAINDFSKDIKYFEQIERFGQYYNTIEVNYPITKEENDQILAESKEKSIPLEKVKIITYRDGDIPVNSRVKIKLPPLVTDSFLVASVKSKIICGKTPYNNENLIEREIVFCSYLDDMASILAKAQTRTELADALLEENQSDIITMEHKHIISSDVDTLPPSEFIAAPHALPPLDFTISKTGFRAEWTHVYNAETYILYVSTDNFATYVPGYAGLLVYDNVKDVTGLSPGTTYQYKVQANGGPGTSIDSNIIEVSTMAGNYFPDSVIVDDTEIPLNYVIRWDKESFVGTGSEVVDLTENENNGVFEKRTGAYNYPEWVDNGDGTFSVDLSNIYSALRVSDNDTFELGDGYAVIAIIKSSSYNSGSANCICNRWSSSFASSNSHMLYEYQDDLYSQSYNTAGSPTSFHTHSNTNVFSGGDLGQLRAVSVFTDYPGSAHGYVNGQADFSYTIDSGGILQGSVQNSPLDLFVGTFTDDNGGSYGGGNFQGTLHGFAIIKQAGLTKEIIKKIFENGGF